MAEPFLGEIRLMSFVYPPKGWTLCNGQLLPINQNQALFSLLGTAYGGDGRVTFGLPDLRGRVPVHVGGSFSSPGARLGEYAHTLNVSELPAHNHAVNARTANGTTTDPANALLAGTGNAYHAKPATAALRADTVTNTGGGQPHSNQQPFLTLSFCIATQGIFPSQN
jgi:microcystin-dependent protein